MVSPPFFSPTGLMFFSNVCVCLTAGSQWGCSGLSEQMGALVMQAALRINLQKSKSRQQRCWWRPSPTLLTTPALPLGEWTSVDKNTYAGIWTKAYSVCVCVCFPGSTHTVALWKSCFILLQDEDQDVRDGAADFTCYIPAHLQQHRYTHTHNTHTLKEHSGFSASEALLTAFVP